MLNSFCHLHLHTQFSLLDGFGTAKNYVKRAKEIGYKYLSCTDHSSVDGCIDFQKQCLKNGIKPILGCEFYIVENAQIKESRDRKHITILAKNDQGWQNILQMLTYANFEGFYYKPRIDYDCLLDHLDGLVIMSACLDTFIVDNDFMVELVEAMPDVTDFYLEVMPHNIKEQKELNKKIVSIANDNGLKIIGSNDCHYINKNDWEAQETLLAIQTKAKWNDKDRFKFKIKGLHLRTPAEMFQAFLKQNSLTKDQILTAMNNTIEVAEKCSKFRIKKQDIFLPEVPEYKGQNKADILWELCQKGLENIDKVRWENDEERYLKRLKEEFDLITSKKFEGYFLIVYELINWCSENDIMIGPGRGSVGGSLISYLLGITCVDPFEYNLLFSRFISEERIDYPDIDIDFEDTKRDLVKQHLEDLYSKGNIAGVSTFLTMKGRGAIRDVARVFDIPYKQVDEFAKAIGDATEKSETGLIKKAIKETKEGKWFYKKYPNETNLAIKLEGQIRGVGVHAAASIISAELLANGTRAHLVKRKKATVINWSMEDSEYVGLMKLDILGLSTLTILNETKKLVKENHNLDIVFSSIKPNDPKVFEEFAQGHNEGTFQFSSHGLTDLCKKMKIKSFSDLVVSNALYRPGTLRSGMVDEYLERKNGKKFKSIHKKIDEITKETFGIIIYQEQVMNLANQLARMPWKDADKIRKVIGKSKGSKELHKFKDEFVNGCIDNKTLSESVASKLWNDLETFGGYSFNLSHSAEYSLLGYWCVDGTTKLYDWNNKQYITISKAFKNGIKKIACYDEKKKKTVSGKVKAIIRTTGAKFLNLKMAYIVRTKSYKTLKCSIEHKFLTPNGYIELKKLKVGDLVAVEKRVTKPTKECRKKASKALKKYWSSMPNEVKEKRLNKTINNETTAIKQKRKNSFKKYWTNLSKKAKEKKLKNFIDAGANSDNGYKKRFVGYALDGHKVYSYNELVLDNWFYKNKLDHTTQIYINGKFADFFCKGIYIEFDGMNRSDEYFENKFLDEPYIVIKYIKDIENKLQCLLEEESLLNGDKIIFEPIIKIEKWKERVMYDVVMEKEPHNFLANGIVVHNCQYVKTYYPTEFICASLTYGSEGNKNGLIKEASRLGLTLVLPKVGVSEPNKWIAKDNKLYVPFVEVKGFGEKTAITASTFKRKATTKRQGFFSIKANKVQDGTGKKTKTETILDDIGAFNKDNAIPKTAKDYFSFQISQNPKLIYPELHKIIDPRKFRSTISEIVTGEIKKVGVIQKKRFRNKEILECNKCELRNECSAPVLSSMGIYNITILGEAPGCISGDSYIDTAFRNKLKYPKGIKIKDLVGQKGFYVYSFDTKNQKMVLGKVKKVWKTGKKELYKITYEWWYANGGKSVKKIRSIKATKNHLFLLRNYIAKNDPFKGIQENTYYLSINKGLRIGHSLQPFHRFNDRYSFIGPFSTKKVKESRFLLEQKIGRKLKSKEQCHHKNEQKLDDEFDNLNLHTISSHSRYHISKNNPMNNIEVRKKHKKIMQSEKYRKNMHLKMKQVLKKPEIYQARLKQIQNSNKQRSQTVKDLHNNPIYRYKYLMGRKNRWKEWSPEIVEKKFKNQFPDIDYPPKDNHKIISIDYVGFEDVYDIEIEKYHNFAVNGIFIHNSNEDKEGKGFVGAAGEDILWPEIEKYGLKRKHFHIANIIHCFPSETKAPNIKHIKICWPWLQEELEKIECRLILAFGNTSVKCFTEMSGGIMNLSGKTEWNEKAKAWICWCVHPAAVLHNRDNKRHFEEGIRNFIQTIKRFGIDEILY